MSEPEKTFVAEVHDAWMGRLDAAGGVPPAPTLTLCDAEAHHAAAMGPCRCPGECPRCEWRISNGEHP